MRWGLGRNSSGRELDFLLAARLFPLYVVGNSVGFGHVLRIRSLAYVVSASSKEKILRLDSLHPNLKSNL